jgi:hypothetical protein
MHKLLFIAALTISIGCKKKTEDATGAAGESGGAAKAAEPTGPLPPLTAEPEVPEITPAEKPMWEMVKFRMLGKRSANGWPAFQAYNLGNKQVRFLNIYGYAYDKAGTQVARTKTNLSWNGKLPPGGKTDWDITVGGDSDKVPASAASYALCYDVIKFEGDEDMTRGGSCPEQMPKK